MQYNQRTLLYVAATLLYVAAALLYVVAVLLYVLVVWWNTSTVLLYNINLHALRKNLKMAKQMVLFVKHWAKTGGFETKSGEQSRYSKAMSLHQACGVAGLAVGMERNSISLNKGNWASLHHGESCLALPTKNQLILSFF